MKHIHSVMQKQDTETCSSFLNYLDLINPEVCHILKILFEDKIVIHLTDSVSPWLF